jgi:hypothetical protein
MDRDTRRGVFGCPRRFFRSSTKSRNVVRAWSRRIRGWPGLPLGCPGARSAANRHLNDSAILFALAVVRPRALRAAHSCVRPASQPLTTKSSRGVQTSTLAAILRSTGLQLRVLHGMELGNTVANQPHCWQTRPPPNDGGFLVWSYRLAIELLYQFRDLVPHSPRLEEPNPGLLRVCFSELRSKKLVSSSCLP